MARAITLYTKHGCGPCLITKKFLTEHDIPFKEINVSEQPTGLVELQERDIKSVPVTVIGDWEDYWTGLDMDKLEGLTEVEQLYYIQLSEHQYAQWFDADEQDLMLVNSEAFAGLFTEEEIKNINPNLMVLAVAV